jgi:hypothetical protein
MQSKGETTANSAFAIVAIFAFSTPTFYLSQPPPTRNPQVFAPDVVKLYGAIHGSIAFMPDGSEIY